MRTEARRGSAAGEGRDATRLRSLATIVAAIGASRRFADVLELAAEEAREAIGAASISISRWERDEGLLRTLINVGDLGPGEKRFPTDETYDLTEFSEVFTYLTSNRVFYRRAGDPLPPCAKVDMLDVLCKGSEASAGIVFSGELWGELYATTAIGDPPFDDDDLQFLSAVAGQVGAGLASAEYLARLEALAHSDPLTSLANRRSLDDHLQRALDGSTAPVTLVMCDVDGLKEVNDLRGHAAGDAALVDVADALRFAADTAPGSLAARIGGDEFCLLLVGCEAAEGVVVAQRALDRLAARGSAVSVSCGIATTAASRDPGELLRAADAAQYAAKYGGSGVRVHTGVPGVGHVGSAAVAYPPPAAHGNGRPSRRRPRGRPARSIPELLAEAEGCGARSVRGLRGELAALVDGGGLGMVFQPLADLRDGRVAGYEALARFRTADPHPPDHWFRKAAEVGLSVDLELGALAHALAAFPRLAPDTFLSVNLSPEVLCSPRLPALLGGADPRRLILELTEHSPVQDYGAVHDAMGPLRAAGVRLAVDDVGAGYATLAHVLRLRPELIKLDLQLTRNVDEDPVLRALARGLCAVAERMGATIIAEGVESPLQLAALRDCGIVLGQGFWLGAPAGLPLPATP